MKILFAVMLAFSASAFAQKEGKLVGENASAEYKNCLSEDKCPSQRCANSCAMINNGQFKEERSNVKQRTPGKKGAVQVQ